METPRPVQARWRAWISILLSLLALMFSLPQPFFLPWIWPPLISGQNRPGDLGLSTGAFLLFLAVSLASVITAFYNQPRPLAWPGKVAMILALPVAVLILPLSILMFIIYIQMYFIHGS